MNESAEIARLTYENEKLQLQLAKVLRSDPYKAGIDQERELMGLKAENELLRKQLIALAPYIDHKSDCMTSSHNAMNICDCGLSEALAAGGK